MHNVGILGNCCTHGAGLAAALKARPDVRIVTGFERNPRRAGELEEAMGCALATDYEAVVGHPDVDIVVITTDPGDKADMAGAACAAGKHILHNKPLCADLSQARHIVAAVEAAEVKWVYDIPMVKSVPAFVRLAEDLRRGRMGEVLSYFHAFGMTFAEDFPIAELWPERFDPPEKSGGGEMTNMGCYAVDYAVSIFGPPRAVRANWQRVWPAYAEAGVENFGQIALDYGKFEALLAVGKQQLPEPRQHANSLLVSCEHANLFLDPNADALIRDGVPSSLREYVADVHVEGSFDQLVRCISTDAAPTEGAAIAALGVEVLMAAYESICAGGEAIPLPVADGAHPLVRAAPPSPATP